MKRKKPKNFLDYIPVRNPEFEWSESEDVVTVDMVHKGVFAFIAQKVFRRPRVSHVRLDEYGSFLWKAMDGETDVAKLGELLADRFGEAANPLYPRLVTYIQTLRNNKFVIICYRK